MRDLIDETGNTTVVTQRQLPIWNQSTLRIWQNCGIFVFACIILISRRPDAIFHAQFFAEDGRVWFADAYNLGWWHALLRAQDGYFQTFPRLAAALALLVPLSRAPLVLNLVALAAQVLPVYLLLSSRSAAWGSLRFRGVLAFTYLAVPNSREMTIEITNSQWILTFAVFLILVCTPPIGTMARVFDVAVLTLCGLTGPFCFFLSPIAAFVAWRRRDRWSWIYAALLAVSALVQSWALLVLDPSGRSHSALGARPALLPRILGGQICFATLVGRNNIAVTSGSMAFVLVFCALVLGASFIAICFLRSRLEMRLFIVLTAMLLTASLVSPVAYPPSGMSRWELLANVAGIRYWFLPTLAFAWSLLWALRSRSKALRSTSLVLLCLMCFGVARDWKTPRLKDLHFAELADQFESAPPGTAVIVPENPDGWNFTLVRRASF